MPTLLLVTFRWYIYWYKSLKMRLRQGFVFNFVLILLLILLSVTFLKFSNSFFNLYHVPYVICCSVFFQHLCILQSWDIFLLLFQNKILRKWQYLVVMTWNVSIPFLPVGNVVFVCSSCANLCKQHVDTVIVIIV